MTYNDRMFAEKSKSDTKSGKREKSPTQMDATLLANNTQHYWMLHVASVCTPCCMLLGVVEQNLKPVKRLTQQLPAFLWFRDHRSVVQQRWIRFYSPANMVRATRVHYTWSPKSYGLYPSHDALQVPAMSGTVAPAYKPLPTRTQQLPTLLAQQC